MPITFSPDIVSLSVLPRLRNAEVWLIANGHWLASADLGAHPGGWSPAGVGDFNHDGISDIAWRGTATNHVESWLAYS